MTIDVRPARDRPHTELSWLDSWHSFSFGHHWDPDNTHHGLLVVSNDDVIAPGTGFNTHPHRDMEIVTWVLEGELEHRDSIGTVGRIYPGLAQRMSAGSGITHSERNASSDRQLHLVQMWVLPDENGIEPGYEQRDLTEALDAGGLVAVASGAGIDGAVALHQRDATLWAARLRPDEVVTIPGAPHTHLYVARGAVDLDTGSPMSAGDAARLSGGDSPSLTAGPHGAEVLIWATA